jgi:hypothetical protein
VAGRWQEGVSGQNLGKTVNQVNDKSAFTEQATAN